MYQPSNTYRIQFHENFNFKSFDEIIPYLKKLGIDTIYASPIFEAMPGSVHGYDCVSPLKINPEIGNEEELIQISKKLKKLGIGWIQDIVPNHMAFHSNNKWLMDVLEKGKASEFASFFDINFSDEDKLMVPFLGENLDETIRTSDLQIEEINQKFSFKVSGSYWPLNAASAKIILDKGVAEINSNHKELHAIADMQFYRLCNWQETNTKINYRRFFTVNNLICLNIQDEQNFIIYHQYILELLYKGIFQGLRIDHIDGLYDPKEYLDRLRVAVGEETYIVVEKILETREQLPNDWNAQGTTGYDFLAMMNNLFTNNDAEEPFNNLYQSIIGKILDTDSLIIQKKTAILYEHMHGELDNLFQLFIKLELVDKQDLDRVGLEDIKLAIGEMLIHMPVYRFYDYDFPLSERSVNDVKSLFDPLKFDQRLRVAGSLLMKVLLENPLFDNGDYDVRISKFYQRCMQFTGPLMAKGVEDTVMFTYNRFVGHSEVGDAPDAFGLTTNEFHKKMINRQLYSPLSMNGSSTHDTKKGEDVRARLNVLTDLPLEWSELIRDLQQSTAARQSKYPSLEQIHKNDICLIYQTILGALPMPNQDEDDFQDRVAQYMEKALREAKKRSNWAEPDENYESTVKDFAKRLLDENLKGAQSIAGFLKDIADFGIVNSLSQLLLKCTCPGIPDFYQGTEMWDLSLVDPDNRRPVDYKKMVDFERDLNNPTSLKTLWHDRYSGKIKLWLTQLLVKTRKANQSVFDNGTYIPLKVKGKYSKNIFAFAREFKMEWFVTVIPLGIAGISKEQSLDVNALDWYDTQIILPTNAPLNWTDILNHKSGSKDFLNEGILISQLFGDIPLGFIALKKENSKRSAGILMHITSLPSAFGIGDFGPEAFKFIDFLSDAKQKYWQILPLNPTKKENGHSPYSSNSAMAGNTLLVSPESLLADGLLNNLELAELEIINHQFVDFETAAEIKNKLLKEAFKLFGKQNPLNTEYQNFIKKQKHWLDDFSVYLAIKSSQNGLEWYNWPQNLKRRDENTLAQFIKNYHKEIEEVKFQQFIFSRQWHRLKNYANSKKVEIIGDLPFYLDRDSAEVWSQPDFFLLDEELNPTMVAGVPPDYFNEKGQLWGMPIFNWSKMKRDNYTWWIKRLRSNIQLYDLVRLDHFRAFSAYWEIPAGDDDAVNGFWKPGPNADFFKIMENEFKELPFLAEDLGEISDDVAILRDQFKLPGMKVLQFAFGEDLSLSPHIPHNFDSVNCIVYSGTHDNNTVKGWYKQELNEEDRLRLSAYNGIEVNEENVNEAVINLCFASIAKIVILPMQDILSLDEKARMNVPGSSSGNWLWRLKNNDYKKALMEKLRSHTEMYGRAF